MVCGGGDPTGFGLRPGADATELVVYLAGGGACWDPVTCFGLQTAASLEVAWGEDHLQAELGALEATGLLDPGTPLADATWAYVPYCTGDLHLGTTVRTHDPTFQPDRRTHHVGDVNLSLVLEELARTNPDAERIWLLGTSAGGYGVQLQAGRVASAWPDAEITVFADSAPVIQPGEARWSQWRNAWAVEIPTGCADCPTSLPAFFGARVAATPDATYALATTDQDAVITLFFAQPLGGLATPVHALVEDVYLPDPRLSVFVRASSDRHVLLGDASNHVASDGTVLSDFVADWARGASLTDHP
jgi:hypothetical protein